MLNSNPRVEKNHDTFDLRSVDLDPDILIQEPDARTDVLRETSDAGMRVGQFSCSHIVGLVTMRR